MKKFTKKHYESTPSLKIGLVLDDTLDVPDGVQQYVLTIGEWMTKMGHEVHYLVGKTSRKDIKNVHSMSKNVKVSFNQNKMRIPFRANKKKIREKLEELDLDVIHVQMPYSPVMAGKIINAAPNKVKLVGTFHVAPAGFVVSLGTKALKSLSRKTLKRFDSIISVSEAAQEFARNTFKVESTVLPNVVDVKKFQHRPIKRKYLHIVVLGRLVERKGQIWLLKSLKQLQNIYNDDYKVTIAGKGPMKSKLEKYIKNNDIKNVNLIGFIEESAKPKLLASADIAVFPSTGGESFGIVLIEAMAANSRVVMGGNNVGYATVLGKHPDLLFDPTNTYEFTKKLALFMKNDQARIRAHHWNIKEIKKYDVNKVGLDLLSIYKS